MLDLIAGAKITDLGNDIISFQHLAFGHQTNSGFIYAGLLQFILIGMNGLVRFDKTSIRIQA